RRAPRGLAVELRAHHGGFHARAVHEGLLALDAFLVFDAALRGPQKVAVAARAVRELEEMLARGLEAVTDHFLEEGRDDVGAYVDARGLGGGHERAAHLVGAGVAV